MIDTNEISQFLTPELCEDAGIIVTNISDDKLDLGAMNLDYIKVKNLIKTIESKYDLQVSLKQITSIEWENWFENNHGTSVETIQKNLQNNQFEERITEEETFNIEELSYQEKSNSNSIPSNPQNDNERCIEI